MGKSNQKFNRRDFMRYVGAAICVTSGGFLYGYRESYAHVWQLDPNKCIQCGNCATSCVLFPSAVKCFHDFSMCGYCDLCSGYLIQDAANRDTGAENQLCPSGALKRKFIENPYFEYTVDDKLCLGCGRCVKGCGAFGNGSLLLQINHELCVDCNQCAIIKECPSGAFKRVPRDKAYILKSDVKKERS